MNSEFTVNLIASSIQSCSVSSYVVFSIVIFGYILQSNLLVYLYYYLSAKVPSSWKIQSSKVDSCGYLYSHPLISNKPQRGPYHRIITTLNLFIAGVFAFTITELCMRNQTKMIYDPLSSYGLYNFIMDIAIIVAHESIIEYYWHRLMHTKYFYRIFHKMHHHYKSPEPFDDMYIHPVEAFGYYCILYSPPMVYNIHGYAFIIYMIIMGICGVLDHSGIRLSLPGIYDTADHDDHHAKFDVNYGFPFIFMDILHGTYEGCYLGKTFKRCKN